MAEVFFQGPFGRLEGRFFRSENPKAPFVLVLPPNPMQGNNMNNKVTYAIFQAFVNLGFSVLSPNLSPEVETEYINFDMLNFPEDHPAKDMQDTFYTKVAPNVILRGQTSGAQIHTMEAKKPPLRIISPGRVYRCESVSARKNNLFHQIECEVATKL